MVDGLASPGGVQPPGRLDRVIRQDNASWHYEGRTGSTDQQFDVSLMCDDLDKTMAELTARGAEFTGDVRDEGWGITARLKIPGAGEMTLYQPNDDPPATSG